MFTQDISQTPHAPRSRIKKRGAVFSRSSNGDEKPETPKRKRKRGPGQGYENSQKRPRLEITTKSIHYDAVYQNRRAVKKHNIIRRPADPARPAKYYVLRCEQHDLSFDDEPLEEASDHLAAEHKTLSSSFDSVIKHLAYEVIDCDDRKRLANNNAWREDLEKGGDGRAGDYIRVRTLPRSPSPEPSHATKRQYRSLKGQGPRSNRSRRSMRLSGGCIPQINLVPGEIYKVYWLQSKQWFAAILLPLHDLESIGLDQSAEEMGLLTHLPHCYQYDSSSMSFSWAQGYEDDGPKCSEQEFAFIFFEGVRFPEDSHVAWVPIGDIREWHEREAKTIEYSQQVLDYIKEREKNRPRLYGPDDEIPDSDDDDSFSDFGSPASFTHPSTDPQPAQTNETVMPDTTQEAEVTEKTGACEDIDVQPDQAAEEQERDESEQDFFMDAQEDMTESVAEQNDTELGECSEQVVEDIPKDAIENAPPKADIQPEALETNDETILDSQEDTDEVVPSHEEPEANTPSEAPDLPREPGADRLSSADLQNLLHEGEDLELHFSQYDQREVIDDSPASTIPEQASLNQMASNVRDDIQQNDQGQQPLVTAGSPSDKAPEDLPSNADMGRESSQSEDTASDRGDSPPQIQPPSRSGTPRNTRTESETTSQPPVLPQPSTPLPLTALQRLAHSKPSTSPEPTSSSQPSAASPPPTVSRPSTSQPETSEVPFRTEAAERRPVAQVATSPRPTVSNIEQPGNIRSESQTPSVLAPPFLDSAEIDAGQAHSEVLRHPHAVQSEAPQEAEVDAHDRDPEPSTKIITLKVGSLALSRILRHPHAVQSEVPQEAEVDAQDRDLEPSTKIITLKVGSLALSRVLRQELRHQQSEPVSEATSQSANSISEDGSVAARNTMSDITPEPRPSTSLVQSQIPQTIPSEQSTTKTIPEPEPVVQECPATQPNSPAPQQRPSPEATVVQASRSASLPEVRPVPQDTASQQNIAASVPQPVSLEHQDQQHVAPLQPPVMSASQTETGPIVQKRAATQPPQQKPPSQQASMASRSASPFQHQVSQATALQQDVSRRNSVVQGHTANQPRPSASQPSPRVSSVDISRSASPFLGQPVPRAMASPQCAALPTPQPGSVTQGHSMFQPLPSPRPTGAEIQRPRSTMQGYSSTQPTPSPHPSAQEIPRSPSVLQGHLNSQSIPPPQMVSSSLNRRGSDAQQPSASEPLPSPRQSTMEMPRPGSATPILPPPLSMASPYQYTREIPAPPAFNGHPVRQAVPSPRPPYAVPVQQLSHPLASPHQYPRQLPPQHHPIHAQPGPHMGMPPRQVPHNSPRPSFAIQGHRAPIAMMSPQLPTMEVGQSNPALYGQWPSPVIPPQYQSGVGHRTPDMAASPQLRRMEVPQPNLSIHQQQTQHGQGRMGIPQQNYPTEGHPMPNVTASPQTVAMQAHRRASSYSGQPPPMMASPRLIGSNISRPGSAVPQLAQPAQRMMPSPQQTHIDIHRPHPGVHQQPGMPSPRQAAAEIPRSRTALSMHPPSSAKSPVLVHTGPPRPRSSAGYRNPYPAPSMTPLPSRSRDQYQSSAPAAYNYVAHGGPPAPSAGHPFQYSGNATQAQGQQYAITGGRQIANSTPRFCPPAQSQVPAKDLRLHSTPLLPLVSSRVQIKLKARTRVDYLEARDFLNFQNYYQCPFCSFPIPVAKVFIEHLKSFCKSLQEVYREDQEEQMNQTRRGRAKQTKRKSKTTQAEKNARIRC